MRIWLFSTIAFVLNACSSTEPTVKRDKTMAHQTITQPRTASPQNFNRSATYSGAFHKPGELEPAVEFWRKTYSVWHRSEVAFHDDRYLDVVYEVMVLPGYVDESLTSEQRKWSATAAIIGKPNCPFWRKSKLRYNAPLNATDRQLIAKIKSSGRQRNSVFNGAAERVRSQRGTRERFKQGLEIKSPLRTAI